MQVFPKCTKILDYPDTEARKDLWATPRAPIGIAKEYHNHIFLLYWKGKPLTIFAQDVPKDAAIEYALGPAFSIAPPLLICCNGNTILETLALRGNSYVSIASPLSWMDLERIPPGQISPTQAEAVIEHIAKENRHWFEDERSQRVINALPRIFPEGTIILYELLQNAADSGATRSAFRIENNTLIFLHNGDPFTENDVAAISFVNWSFKPPETIGFMGLGFKAAYEVSDRPEVHSPPYEFSFDGEQDGGSLFPFPLAADLDQEIPDGFTTLFRFPLKPNADSWVKKELERFDGRLLLYIGGQLSEVETPNRRFYLHPIEASDDVQHVALESSMSEKPRHFVVFRQPFTPSEDAISEFARSRNANPDSYRGRTQQVSIAAELLDGNVVIRSEGQLQVYLPTSISLPFAFDVQGNFIITASRQELRRANGPWNSEHFAQIGELLANVLNYAKDLASTGEQNWITYYDLLPLWEEIPERFSYLNPEDEETTSPIARVLFNQRLLNSSLIPATDKDGNLVFDNPDKVTYIDPDLEGIIESRELAKLANIRPLWPGLSDTAKERLGQYVSGFGPVELAKCLQESHWETRVSLFKDGIETPSARQLLIRILAYLEGHPVQLMLGSIDKDKIRVILTEDKRLHAKLEEGLSPIRSLPATEVDFPQEELQKQYELVHRTLLRDLRRPGESGVESGIARAALTSLIQLAPELTAEVIAKEIIYPVFAGTAWKDIPDDRLFRYTRFLQEHSDKIVGRSIQIKVKVRGPERIYLLPTEVYFGREYSLDGERLEQLCGSAVGIPFISGDYIVSSTRIDRIGWVNFFSSLGVASKPRVFRHTQNIHESEIEKLREEVGNPELLQRDLRASSIKDGQLGDYVSWNSYSVDDYQLDSRIVSRVQSFYREKTAGWKEGLRAFAVLIEGGWEGYSKYSHKILRYVLKWESYIHRTPQPALSSFGKLLKEEQWMPALDINDAFKPCDLVLPSEENKQLASEETVFAIHAFTNNIYIDFLDIHKIPPGSTPMGRLRGLVQRKSTELDRFKVAYKEIAQDSTLSDNAMRQRFSNEDLIFVPSHEEHYLPLGRVLFRSTTVLRPYFAAVGDLYPELADFFCDRLGLAKDEEISHYARFLKEYVWIGKPSMTDALRDGVVSCYRRLLHYLAEHGGEDAESTGRRLDSLLGEQRMVFCGPNKGWVRTAETMVIYPDTSNYLSHVEEKAGIPVESHIKRLERSLVEVEPLLRLLNLKALSEVIDERPVLATPELLSNSDELRDRLVLMLSCSIDAAKSLDTDTESIRPRSVLFLRQWELLAPKLGNVSFFRCPSIQVAVYVRNTGSLVYEGNLRAYLLERHEGIDIYLAGEILEVYDALFDNISRVIKLELLPAEVREVVGKIISGNIARLDHPRFPQLLRDFLVEQGLAIQDDRTLEAKMVQVATSLAEAGAIREDSHPEDTTEGQVSVQEFPAGEKKTATVESGTESLIDVEQIPTIDEILAQMPAFSDDSFADTSIIELKREQWGAVAPGQGTGGGHGHGRGRLSARQFALRKVRGEAYGKRGEAWVFEREKRKLQSIGKEDLAKRVVHRSLENPGNPWDIESYEKSPPFERILIEVKSTVDEDDFTIDISANQIRHALSEGRYYIYRVLNIASANPKTYVYLFKDVWTSDKIVLSAETVYLTLPKPQSLDQSE